MRRKINFQTTKIIRILRQILIQKKKKMQSRRGETVKRNPNSLEQNKLLHFRSRIRKLESSHE